MIRILSTVLAAVFGLAFGSFLNVCLSRWPQGESVVSPGSHCRDCDHVLAWWENIPLLSWMILHGKCKGCGAEISWRYPVVELLVASLWALSAWQRVPDLAVLAPSPRSLGLALALSIARITLIWILIALAFLDLEHLWLPDALTLPGILLAFAISAGGEWALSRSISEIYRDLAWALASALLGAGIILAIRGVYWLFRRSEGIGLGDAKLMAMLGAWLGIQGMLLAFFIAVTIGALAGLVILLAGRRHKGNPVAQRQLPLGTFLCFGAIVYLLWGRGIMSVYLRWAGL